ncbi:hypothetical protein TWF481_011946 [Arthrobotrys musiformis]|uniref:CFEM domain-containing protein n=1 Tax=Arthrobotrys musiformis TaxID=47236 RepID=A0AAV9VWY9_9PEZI
MKPSSLLTLTTLLLTTSTTAAPTTSGPRLLIDALLYGLPNCIRRCVESSLDAGGCNEDKEQVIVCLCEPKAQVKMLAPVTECVREKSCNVDVFEAQKKAVHSCQVLGYM